MTIKSVKANDDTKRFIMKIQMQKYAIDKHLEEVEKINKALITMKLLETHPGFFRRKMFTWEKVLLAILIVVIILILCSTAF